MKKILLLLLLIATPAYADISERLNIAESDGSPTTYPYQMKVTNGSLTDNGDGTITLNYVGGASLSDPNADRIVFWDDSATAYAFLTVGSGLNITGTSLTATAASSGWNGGETLVSLNTSDANVVIGGTTNLGKFGINGDADEDQLMIEGHSTQTNGNLIVARASDGTTRFALSGDGTATFSGTGTPSATFGSGSTASYKATFNLSGTDPFLTATSNELSVDGVLAVGDGATAAGTLKLYEDTDSGANFATFSVDALAANTVYTLPADDGSANEVLATNGAGLLDWVTAASGSPGGSNANVQYNSGSSFAGDGAFSWNATTNSLGISRDAGQTGFAIVISSDSGASLAGISHDGTITTTGLTSSGNITALGGTGYTTSGTILSTATGSLGWVVVDQTDNQACTTGCTNACVVGIENATGTAVTNLVSCDNATADLCLCAGSS